MELKNYIQELNQDILDKLITAVTWDVSTKMDIMNQLNELTHYYQELDSPFFMERGPIARKLIQRYYTDESVEAINHTIGGVYPITSVFNNHMINIVILDANFQYPQDQQPNDEFVILIKADNEDQLNVSLEFLTSML